MRRGAPLMSEHKVGTPHGRLCLGHLSVFMLHGAPLMSEHQVGTPHGRLYLGHLLAFTLYISLCLGHLVILSLNTVYAPR